MNNWTFDELDRLIGGLRFMAKHEAQDNQAQEGLRYWASRAEAIKRSLEWERDQQEAAKRKGEVA